MSAAISAEKGRRPARAGGPNQPIELEVLKAQNIAAFRDHAGRELAGCDEIEQSSVCGKQLLRNYLLALIANR